MFFPVIQSLPFFYFCFFFFINFPHLCFSNLLHLHLLVLVIFPSVLVCLFSAYLHITPVVNLPLSCLPVSFPCFSCALCVPLEVRFVLCFCFTVVRILLISQLFVTCLSFAYLLLDFGLSRLAFTKACFLWWICLLPCLHLGLAFAYLTMVLSFLKTQPRRSFCALS